MEYANDLSKLISDHNNICRYQHNVEENLSKKELKVNKNKNENYIIIKQNHQWKKCKLLGTLLGTEEDINREKILAINNANNLRRFFENDKLTIKLKLQLIYTYIEPIFLYNSETWTLTKSMEESINAFQWRIVRRYCFNIKWPKTLSNGDFYERTKIIEWKKKVTVRRLKRFGKMAGAPEEILAKVALRYRLSNYARPRGKPKTTWISKVKENLNEMNLSWLEAENLAIENYNGWVRIIKRYFDI